MEKNDVPHVCLKLYQTDKAQRILRYIKCQDRAFTFALPLDEDLEKTLSWSLLTLGTGIGTA